MTQATLFDPHFDGKTYDAALDGERLGRQLDRVRDLLLARRGEWFTLAEIRRVAGGSEAGGNLQTMIKFTAGKEDGATLIGLGLSEGNLAKLKEGKPIVVWIQEMIPDCKMEVLIFYGATEQAMYEELKPMLKNVPIHEFKEKQ